MSKRIKNNNRKRKAVALMGVLPACLLVILMASCSGKPALSQADAYILPYYIGLKEAKNSLLISETQTFIRDSLDMAILYESSLWSECLSGWLSSYPAAESKAKASEALINRAASQSPAVLKSLVRELCLILKNSGDTQTATAIAAYPYGIDANERPDIAARLLTSTLLPGTKAPAIGRPAQSGEKHTATILLFYDSRCRSCQGIIDEITGKYPALRELGVRVISFSTDTDEQIFTEYSSRFPWPDKLCDYRGFYGPDIENYGVAATPTLFLIDREGIVTGQYDAPDDIWNVIFEK
ncbi:MAG: peroxiredoxin family protein [Proteiniphilum sp.]|jgi:peroxiredoxin|nr:peroxiredoxin family protein [Proteiniphilum sp.]